MLTRGVVYVVQKCQLFVNSYKVENVNVGQKRQNLANVVKECPLRWEVRWGTHGGP